MYKTKLNFLFSSYYVQSSGNSCLTLHLVLGAINYLFLSNKKDYITSKLGMSKYAIIL